METTFKMKLNGEPFETYATDTPETIDRRIAARLGTTPRWLLWTPSRPTDRMAYDSADLTVTDYRAFVSNRSELSPPAGPRSIGVTAEEVENVFVATNRSLASAPENQRRLILVGIESALGRDVSDAWYKRAEILEASRAEIRANREESERETRAAERFERVPTKPFTDYELDRVQFTLRFDTTVDSLGQLFDAVVPSKTCPYAVFYASRGSLPIFKIRAGFPPDDDWLAYRAENVMVLKIASTVDAEPTQSVDYSTAAFAIDAVGLAATTSTRYGKRYASRDAFVDRLKSSFDVPLEPTSSTGNLVVSYCSIPYLTIDTAVFADLVMNDETIASVVAIDESTRASKATENLYLRRLAPFLDTVNAVTKRAARKNERGTSRIGDDYVWCRMKTASEYDIRSLQTIVGKVATVYERRFDEIVNVYVRYLPSFVPIRRRGPRSRKSPIGGSDLRSIAPEIFYPTYSRKCSHAPVVVTEGDDDEYSMPFPTKGEESDGEPIPTRTYRCPDGKYPFVGLKPNDLGNRDLFPYVPCCFARNQRTKRGSPYRAYFYGEGRTERGRRAQNAPVSSSRRELNPGETDAALSPNVAATFATFERDPDVVYSRYGVTRSPYAAFEAMLVADGRVDYERSSEDRISRLIARTVARISDDERYAAAARQELYDESAESIKRILREGPASVDLVVRTLETAFHRDVFLFDAVRDELIVPRHARAYFKYRPTLDTVFLLRYAEPDRVDLIVARRAGGPTIARFSPNDPVVVGVASMFREMSEPIAYGVPSGPTEPVPFDIAYQTIDELGKCRGFRVKDSVYVNTPPLPPFAALMDVEPRSARPSSIDEAGRFVARWNLHVARQSVVEGGGAVGLVVELPGGTLGTIALDGRGKMTGVEERASPTTAEDAYGPNALIRFDRVERAATTLYQFTLKALAEYVGPNRRLDAETVDAVLSGFYDAAVRVDPGRRYGFARSDKFAANASAYATTDGRGVMFPSDEAARRALFAARLFAVQHPDELRSMADATVIPRFFSKPKYLRQRRCVFAVAGSRSVRDIKTVFGIDFVLSGRLDTNAKRTRPSFFRNVAIDRNVYVQRLPTESLAYANAVVSAWSIRGSIDDFSVDAELDRGDGTASVYSYSNEREIERVVEADYKEANGIIVGFKRDGATYFVPLLRLNFEKI